MLLWIEYIKTESVLNMNQIDVIYSNELEYDNKLNSKYFNIMVDIIDVCNYHCEYCYNEKNRTGRKLDLIKLYNFIVYLLSTHQNMSVILHILGGEPSLHQQLIYFLNICEKYSNRIRCYIYSNFSLNIETYFEYLKYNAYLQLSWHSLQNDKYNKSFIEKLELIPDIFFKEQKVRILVLYEIDNLKKSIEIFKLLFNSYPNNVSFNFLMDNQNIKCNYTDEMYKEYDHLIYDDKKYVNSNIKNGLIVLSNNQKKYILNEVISDKRYIEFRQFKNYLCDAGKTSFYIHNDGYIYACECYYDLNKKIASLDNFQNISFKQTFCQSDLCGCPDMAKKIKIFKSKQ